MFVSWSVFFQRPKVITPKKWISINQIFGLGETAFEPSYEWDGLTVMYQLIKPIPTDCYQPPSFYHRPTGIVALATC